MIDQTLIKEIYGAKLAFINAEKEKIIEAWIAETGFLPTESVLMQQDLGNGTTRMWIEKKYGDLPKDQYPTMEELRLRLAAAERVSKAASKAVRLFNRDQHDDGWVDHCSICSLEKALRELEEWTNKHEG